MAPFEEIELLFQHPWLTLPHSHRCTVGGALGSSRALVIAAAIREQEGPALVVTSDQHAMEELVDELEFFGLENADDFWERCKTGDRQTQNSLPPVFPFPHIETLPYENKPPEAHLKSDRLRVFDLLSDLAQSDPHYVPDRRVLIVAPVRALLTRVSDLSKVRGAQRVLHIGSELDRDTFVQFLIDEGYESVELISDSGQFSIRGGIVDVFPFTSTEPVRIELFGDEIDSLRTFDILSQRSKQKLETLVLGAADEIKQLVSTWRRNGALQGLAEFLPPETRVFWDLPEFVEKEAERVRALAEKMFSQRSFFEDEGEVEEENPLLDIPPDNLYADLPVLREEMANLDWVELSEFASESPQSTSEVNLPVAQPNLTGIDFKMKIGDLVRRTHKGERFLVVCDNEGQRERLKELILDTVEEESDEDTPDSMRRAALRSEGGANEYSFGAPRGRRTKPKPFNVPGIEILVGAVRRGFRCPETNTTLVTDQEIFGRFRKLRQKRKHGMGVPIVDLVDLAPGNIIVHVDHGIGRFVGLKRLTVGGREGEFLELRYEGEDVLYVPIEQIDRISRYISGSDATPKLSKLGGKVWQAAKARAKKAIEDLTDQLLALYAAREVQEGFRFPRDTTWQHEFEAAFPYDETPDQWKAIQDVKTDMESPRCMDRLICGDVGFGKTEVAMRAAFKAVCEGKQVAVLARQPCWFNNTMKPSATEWPTTQSPSNR